MNLIDRLDRIVGLVRGCGGEVYSRKKLHKAVYLLQESGQDFDQDFHYHFFGVFSSTLAADVGFAQDMGLLREKRAESGGYVISIGNEVPSSAKDFTKKLHDSCKIVSTLAKLEPQDLEVLSTIVYLHKEGYQAQDLKCKLKELKPKLKGRFSKSYGLARAALLSRRLAPPNIPP